jgi:hypothetical protein
MPNTSKASANTTQTIFEVDLLNPNSSSTTFLTRPLSSTDSLAPSNLRIRIDKFGLTTNNKTYILIAPQIPYHKFFPVSHPSNKTALPVWGIGTVVGSRVEGVKVDVKVYGYFPAADYVDLKVGKVGAHGFSVEYLELPKDMSIYVSI